MDSQFNFKKIKIEPIILLCQEYIKMDQHGRDVLRESLKIEECRILLWIADQFAHLAINEQKNEFVFYSLIFHSIEDFKLDYRDNFIRLAVIWYVAERLLLKPMELFDSISLYSSNKAREYFKEFSQRPKQTKSLKSMGLIEKKVDSKIVFVPKPAPWEKEKS